MGASSKDATTFAFPLDAACRFYKILETPKRLAAFLAQIGHESGSLRHSIEVWGPTPAQTRYEGRKDLGNTQPGDGFRYRGRGLIQTTGRYNHRMVRDRLRARGIDCPDFEDDPDQLADPTWAAWSAADYWDWKNCNLLADAGSFEAITVKINGGLNGQADRIERLSRAQPVVDQAFASVQEDQPVEEVAVAPPATAPSLPAPTPSAPWRPSDDPGQYSAEGGLPAPEGAAYSATYPMDGDAEVRAPTDIQTQPSQESNMPVPAVLAKALLPSILQLIPRLATIFKPESANAQRNVEAAVAVAEIVTKAVGAVNAQAAVDVMRNDPAALAAATKAVEANWFEIHKADEESRTAARDFGARYAANHEVRVVVGQLTFLELLSLILVVCTLGAGMVALKWGGLDPQLKGAVVTLMLIGGFTGVVNFWFGSSLGSKKKDDK